jgi:hypothetical protein
MNVEIGAETALFPEKEYISGIFIAVQGSHGRDYSMAYNLTFFTSQGFKS